MTPACAAFVSKRQERARLWVRGWGGWGSISIHRLGVPEPCPFPLAYPFPVHAHRRWVIQPDLPLCDAAHGDIAEVQHLLEAFLILVLPLFVLYAHQQLCTFSWGREGALSWGEVIGASRAPAEQSLQDLCCMAPPRPRPSPAPAAPAGPPSPAPALAPAPGEIVCDLIEDKA